MINAIKLPALRNGEYSQFLAFILKIVSDAGPLALNVQAQYDALKAAYDAIELLFKQATGSKMTDELVALDTLRDNAFLGITSIVRGNTYSTNADVKQAAVLLSDQLALYGANVASDNMLSETATIRNIAGEWNQKPELQSAITRLGLDYWKTDLEAANNRFEAIFLARAKEQGSASPETIRAKRLEANQLYYDLRDELVAWNTIRKGADPYGVTIRDINGVVERYNNLINRRGSSGGDVSTETPPAV